MIYTDNDICFFMINHLFPADDVFTWIWLIIITHIRYGHIVNIVISQDLSTIKLLLYLFFFPSEFCSWKNDTKGFIFKLNIFPVSLPSLWSRLSPQKEIISWIATTSTKRIVCLMIGLNVNYILTVNIMILNKAKKMRSQSETRRPICYLLSFDGNPPIYVN
jgi:fucose 4-O-acetylase-like acetyltransferase